MSLWKLGLISAFALVFVIGTAPAFASDEADAEAAEEMEMEEEDVAVIEITEIIEDLNTDVISSQTSFGDVTADLDLTVSGGTDVSATAAAIANSLSIDSSTGVALETEQIAEGAVVADALVSISNTAGDASATAAAMGNSLSATSEDSLSISSILQDQGPGEFAEGAPEGIAASLSGAGDAGLADFSDIQGELGATAAALGNSATVSAGDIETGVTQITFSGTDAFAGVEATGVDFDASVTAAAIGNSASLDSQSFGIVDLDQLNAGEADLAGAEAWMDNVQGSASATAAAIGNSANVASSDALDLMSTQESDADVASDFLGGMSGIAGDADVTAAAIGNSLSASAGDFDMLTDVLQANGGNLVTADVDSSLEWVGGDASATAAAISNSATFEVGTDLDLVIDQYSAADVNAGYTGSVVDVTGQVDLTAAAIGNSLTADSYQEETFVTTIQTNDGFSVAASLDEATQNVYGALNATAAAIGNSATLGSEEIDVTSVQVNAADIDSFVELNAMLLGGDTKVTAAGIANSLSAEAGGEGHYSVEQSNAGEFVSADLTGTLDGSLGNVDLTGAALGNSATLSSTGGSITTVAQDNFANVGSSVVGSVGMGDSDLAGSVTATAASIANSANITVK